MIIEPVKIAIYGPAGSGKDYVANAIINDFETSLGIELKRFAFADNLKKITNTLIGLDDKSMQDLAIYSEDFKNKYFIDLDTLDKMWILPETPEVYEKSGKQILYKDPKRYGVEGWFTIYTASSLFDLYQRVASSVDHNVIPNMVQNWSAEIIEYPEWYIKETDTFRRLMSYREYIVWIGTYCFQNLLGTSCLVNSMMNSLEFVRYSSRDLQHGVVITDLRFPHEYDACKKAGFKILKIEADKIEADIENIAESHYSKFDPDFIFHNYRDKELFFSEIKRLEEFIS